MIPPVFLIAFSGHRPSDSPGRREEDLAATTERLLECFTALRGRAALVNGEIHLVASLAAGGDIIACEAALSLGMPLHIVLPMTAPAFMGTFGGLEHWIPRAEVILETIAADARHTLRIGSVSATSPECYAEANTRILESADLLVTLSTLAPSKSIAGTTHLLELAKALGIPALNLNPAEPAATLPVIPAAFADPGCGTLKPFRQLSSHIECGAGPLTFAALARCLSNAAHRSSRWFRMATALAISAHALATILAAAAASYYYVLKTGKAGALSDHVLVLLAVVAFIEVILVFGGWWLEHRVHRGGGQRIWLNCRFARELMRGMETSQVFFDPLRPEIQYHQPGWKRFAITASLAFLREQGNADLTQKEILDRYRKKYLDDRLLEQAEWFAARAAEASRPSAWFHFLTHRAALAALLVVGAACVVKVTAALTHSFLFQSPTFLLFLPILLPLLASLGASFGAAFDYQRRAVRYRELAEMLRRAAKTLSVVSTLPDISAVIRQTEEALSDELIEWHAAQRKGLGH
ncbi:MAG: SLATT domain-containing protein [Akkermansiaceae bacterium]|nr:SLATT domain-containing protein [Akkermansiaceae bacterium]